jgi:hypothetical protein
MLGMWLSGLLAAALLLGLWEGLLRALGFQPSVNDDAGLWCLARSRVPPDDPHALVLIGTSRSQLGIDPVVLGQSLADRTAGRRPIQLSILGSSPVPVLEHFAADDTFRGLLLCEVKEIIFFNAAAERDALGRRYVQQYQKLCGSALLQMRLRAACQELFACQNPEVSYLTWRALQRRELPQPQVRVRRDRCRQTYFQENLALEAERQRLYRLALSVGRPFDPEGLATFLDHIQDQVARIQARGGQVVFVRMPSGGQLRQVEERRVPRADYWDQLVRRTTAPCIHYQDHRALRDYRCPDDSHLDYRDAVPFTRALAKVLRRKLQANEPSHRSLLSVPGVSQPRHHNLFTPPAFRRSLGRETLFSHGACDGHPGLSGSRCS